MICSVRGELREVVDGHAVVLIGGVGYQVCVSGYTAGLIAARVGGEIELSTLQFLEGNLAGANLIPRLIGFGSEAERALFDQLTALRGISFRRALKILECSPQDLAAAVERGDIAFLTRLPEIGKKMAAQIVQELQGKLGEFALAPTRPSEPTLSDAARTALEILIAWGDRRADAQLWIAKAMDEIPGQTDPQEIVRTAYRLRG